jgi:hypothetical protein
VNTIKSSSQSSVVRDFKNFQAREILFLMITLEMGIREITFPNKVREGRLEVLGEGDDNRGGGGGIRPTKRVGVVDKFFYFQIKVFHTYKDVKKTTKTNGQEGRDRTKEER